MWIVVEINALRILIMASSFPSYETEGSYSSLFREKSISDVIGGCRKGLEFMVQEKYWYIPDNEIYQTATADNTKAMLFNSNSH